jgi:hypothetical protein
MRIRQITISAAFAAGLAALPLTTAEAQYYPQQQPTPQRTTAQLNRDELARLESGSGVLTVLSGSGSLGMGSPAGMGMGLSPMLAVSIVLAILCGGRRRRHRRDDRHRAGRGAHRGAALLLRAAVLRTALSPPAARRSHSGRRGAQRWGEGSYFRAENRREA